MGNRAVICITEKKSYDENAIGIYLHWNGGRDSVEGFLGIAKKVMESRGQDSQYAALRLVQVIGNVMGGNLSAGLDICKNLDADNYDNGVYLVSPKTLEITGREFFKGTEQQEYDLQEFIDDGFTDMPESYQPEKVVQPEKLEKTVQTNGFEINLTLSK